MGSKIHNIISIIYLWNFKDIIEDIHSLPIEIEGEEEYIIEYINDEWINLERYNWRNQELIGSVYII
jgi:hypothetical protein